MKNDSRWQLEKVLACTIAVILVLLPFHGFFTAWAASNFGHFDLIRIWKELLIAVMGFAVAWVLYKDKLLAKNLIKNRLVQIILVYILFQLVAGLLALSLDKVNLNALLYGWIINIRFLAFFLIALVVAAKTPLKTYWPKLLLWPAVVVICFGLLQLVLSADILRHFGYGPDTIEPYQLVDLKSAYIRLQSTLRGPNPLGTYLLLIVTATTGLILVRKKRRLQLGAFLAGSVVVLYFTYSRSAWVGTFLAIAVLLWITVSNTRVKRLVMALTVGLVLLVSISVGLLRHNDRVQNIFFHTDEHSSSSVSSNFDRASALEGGMKDIVSEPLGRGPGTAGPASLRNDRPARIAENYYLQIGQEVGLIGLILFVTINVYVGLYLWRCQHDTLALILFASLIGISVVNLLSHAWADDTIALIYWGLTGFVLGPAILNKKRKQNAK